MQRRLGSYARLMRLDKPVGIFLLLWPTLWGLWVAGRGHPTPFVVFICGLGAFIMRSAGCVLNDLVDRRFDGHVARTQTRPLVAGDVSVVEAQALLLGLLLIAGFLVCQLNVLTILLALCGVVLTAIYPFCKRVTYWPQALLGLTFGGWPVLIAFAAQTHGLTGHVGQLFVTAALWPLAYDTLYAMVDREDDKKIGIKSTSLRLGSWDRHFVGVLQAIIVWRLWQLGKTLGMPSVYDVGLLLAGLNALYQQYLIRHRCPANCFRAFLSNAWFGGYVFMGFLLGFWFKPLP